MRISDRLRIATNYLTKYRDGYCRLSKENADLLASMQKIREELLHIRDNKEVFIFVDGELLVNLPIRIGILKDNYRTISSIIDEIDSLVGEK